MDSLQTQSTHDLPTEAEMLQKQEDEHFRLQRQVKVIQQDRLHRTMGVHPQFRRQDMLLRRLKEEYVSLVKDLKIAKSGAHRKNDKKMKRDLKKSLLMCTNMEQDCIGGVVQTEQLEGLIQRNKKHVLMLRSLASSTQEQLEERRYHSEYRLASMENKLETAMLRFNAVQGENKKIREDIEHMLKDRMIFNNNWAKMLLALGKGKKFLQDLFESSSVAYDQRDEWCAKLRSMQEKGKIDQMQQIQEMRDIQKALDHEMKIHDFLARKGVKRVNRKQEKRDIEDKLKAEEAIMKQLEYHQTVLDEIHDYTVEQDIQKIIEDFEFREQQNFSTYILLNEYCAECQVLRRDVDRLRRDVEDRRDWNEMKQNELDEKIGKLTEEYEVQKKKTDDLRMKDESHRLLIIETMAKVHEIFNLLDCSVEPFQNLLGEKQPSLWNRNLSFTLITDKIQEYIQIIYFHERYLQKKEKQVGVGTRSRLKKYVIHCEFQEQWVPTSLQYNVPMEPCSTCIEARWLSKVTEAQEVPFDRQMALAAIHELTADPAYEKSDLLHGLTECRLPRSRMLLARRYM